MLDTTSSTPSEICIRIAHPDLITDARLLARYRQLLDEDELARCDRFVFDKDSHLFMVSHALVRTSLSRHFPTHPHEWRFTHTPLGRPEIQRPAGCPNLTFSLSHCDGLAVCVIAQDVEVGIDVEPVDRQTDWRSIAKRHFADSEVRELERCSESEHTKRFMQLWTLKEAYLKARGLGLSAPLRDCAFAFDQDQQVTVQFAEGLSDTPGNWSFLMDMPTERHLMSLAIRHGGEHFSVNQTTVVPLSC
jgi:4'-phosphopantetheinyl transferase